MKTVIPGHYPVSVYIIDTQEFGPRHILAKLAFSSEKAVKWVYTFREGDDDKSRFKKIKNLWEKGGVIGFPVDTGLGSFMDYTTLEAYKKYETSYEDKYPGRDIYDSIYAPEFKKNARNKDYPRDLGNWLNWVVPGTDLNVIMFNSGFGDGIYPSYWGLSEDGNISSIVIDFLVLDSILEN